VVIDARTGDAMKGGLGQSSRGDDRGVSGVETERGGDTRVSKGEAENDGDGNDEDETAIMGVDIRIGRWGDNMRRRGEGAETK